METGLERMSTTQNAALVVQGDVEQDLDQQREEQRRQHRAKIKEEWSQTPHGRLCVELYQKFVEYSVYIEEHPDAQRRPDGVELDFKEHRLFEHALFRMHQRMKEAEAVKLDLGPMEDPDSIQVAIKKLQKAVIDGTLDHKQI